MKLRPLIIAEIGVNHNGSVSLAKKLVLGAKRAGANAVKFTRSGSKYQIESHRRPRHGKYFQRHLNESSAVFAEYRR